MDTANNKAITLNSLIDLTSARDCRSLELALIPALHDFLSNYSPRIALLRVPRHTDCDYLEVIHTSPALKIPERFTIIPNKYGDIRIEKNGAFQQCIHDAGITKHREENTSGVLIPIFTNKLVSSILDIDDDGLTADTLESIRSFIDVYSNFMAIANDNEHDTLTGLRNRKTFDYHLTELLSANSSEKSAITRLEHERREPHNKERHWIGILDIDFFKSVNDNFGHVYGDEVLLLFSEIMIKTLRNNDMLFRYGGEEFVVVLAPTKADDALAVLERFRLAVDAYHFPKVGNVTVSIGYAAMQFNENPTTTLELADEALYYAKKNGRNRVCHYHDLVNQGHLKEKTINDDIELF